MLDKNGCSCLATGIIVQALKDYQKASNTLRHSPDDEEARLMLLDVKKFFRSRWFQTLREFAPETISRNILEEFKNDSKRIS